MRIKDIFQLLPELWISLGFLQCGTWMVFLMYSFNMTPNFYNLVTVGPQLTGLAGAVIAGALLTGLRMWKGRVVFIHFYLVLIGSVLFFVVAILSVVESEYGEVYASALTIGGLAHGLIYVSGMCYVHIRAGKFRAQRIAVLHIMYLVAVATNAHAMHEYEEDYATPREDGLWEYANFPIAYHFFAFSGTAVLILVINILLQGRLYDYKLIQDDKLNMANGKMDNFKGTLAAPIQQAIAPKADHWHQFKVTKVMLLAKLNGGMLFNNLFLAVTFYANRQLFTGEDEEYTFVIHYIALVGLLFGFVASFFIQLKWIFIPSTFVQCILLITGLSLYSGGSYVVAAMFMWLFYIIVGMGYFVPDIALMETCPLPYYETIAAVGYGFEAVPLMIATYFANYSFPPGGAGLWAAGGVLVLGIVLGTIGMIFLYPDTMRRGHIDIQYMVLYPGKVINVRTPPPPGSVTVDITPAPHPMPPPTTTLPAPTPIPVQPPVVPPVPYPEVQKPTLQDIQPAVQPVPIISVTEVSANGSSLYPSVTYNEPTAPSHEDHKVNYNQ